MRFFDLCGPRFAIALACALLALPALWAVDSALAQKAEPKAAAAPTAGEAERLAAAREIFAAQGGTAQAQQLLDETSKSILAQTKASNPQLAEPLARFLKTYFDPESPKVKKLFADVLDASAKFYAARFTVEELKTLAAFLKSPTGQKFVKAAPEASAAAAPPVLEFQRRLTFELQYAFARGDFKPKAKPEKQETPQKKE